jgi:hypothetical protein
MGHDFENDIFISYAHIDNLALSEGENGWVSNFHHALDIRLRQLVGSDAKIWRDAKLQGNDDFSDALINKFPAVALLICIISPRYIKSEWCLREVDEFVKCAEINLGLRLGEKLRVFKVIKTPVSLEKQPGIMQTMLGYEFYQLNPDTGRPTEFSQHSGAYKDPRYWEKLEDLAYEVADLLQATRELGTNQKQENSELSGIYLAPTSSDLKQEYDMVKREFQQRGHPVFPKQPLALNAKELHEQVTEDLSQCELSVHLIGNNYGLIPEASEQSIVELQNQIATGISTHTDLSRIIWIPTGLKSQDPRQLDFIQALETDPDLQQGADVLKSDLSELKRCIQNSLNKSPKPEIDPETEDEPQQIYVIYATKDFDNAITVEDALYDLGCEVISPLLDGSDEEISVDHIENLKSCDAALVYHGNSSESWFRTKMRELRDADQHREFPLKARAVYLAGPESHQKARFQTRLATIMKHYEGFEPKQLDPLMQAIKESE